jgi:hypothetical protein
MPRQISFAPIDSALARASRQRVLSTGYITLADSRPEPKSCQGAQRERKEFLAGADASSRSRWMSTPRSFATRLEVTRAWLSSLVCAERMYVGFGVEDDQRHRDGSRQSCKTSSRRGPEQSSPHPPVTHRNPVHYILRVVYLGSVMKVRRRIASWPCAAMAVAAWEALRRRAPV